MSGTGLNTSSLFDRDAVFPTLRAAGYATAIFGKIHNDQHSWLCGKADHSEPFDHIETECSPCGGYYRDGKNEWVSKQTHDDPHVLETLSKADPQFGTYSEAQYGNRTQRWIRMMATKHPDTPWFAFVGTTGPHLPAIPAWWHAERTRSLPHTAPRTPNFNEHAGDHHALLATQPELDADAIAHVDNLFRARLGTLFSIDDMVAGIMQTLNETGLANNTFVMFTSDHGYHLGQFRIPAEKVQPYETDVRTVFYAVGPGIAPGTERSELVSNIDIGPTLCELAGIEPPNLMDGRSMVPLLAPSRAQFSNASTGKWRDHFVIEFAEAHLAQWGSNKIWDSNTTDNPAAVRHPPWGPGCQNQSQCHATWPNGTRGDYEYIRPSDNWRALRVLNDTDNFIFVQYDKAYVFDPALISSYFAEFYDISADPWQQRNLWHSLPAWRQKALQQELAKRAVCAGTRSIRSNCSGVHLPPSPAPPPPPPSPPSPSPSPPSPSRWMPHTNVVGNPEVHPCLAVNFTDGHRCQSQCDEDDRCVAWVFHFTLKGHNDDPTWRCCRKTNWTRIERSFETTTSGIKNP